ncbi:MAG: TolC family protein [Flavobacterium sp.]|nr:TolC family protein [Flavobacterium sp.]
MKNKITLIAFLVFTLLAKAQESQKKTYTFSLQQAIEFAVQNNYKAINAGRDIEIAKQKRWETTAMGLPQISGNVNYTNNFKLATNIIDFGGVPTTLTIGTKHSANSGLTLSQLLFDGSYIVALQASKTYLSFYQNYKKKTDTEVKEIIINSYGSVLLANENALILQKNKTILEKTIFDTNETFKNGLIEEENVEQLKITLSSVNSNLNYIIRLKEISLKMLKINLGINIDDELTVTDKLDDLAKSNMDFALSTPDFEAKNNINYIIADNFVQQRNLELKLQRSKALPSLSAAANFGYSSFSETFSLLNSNQKYYNYSNLGINLSVPIFSSLGRSAKTQQAKIALEQAKTQLTQAEQQLKLQFQNAKSDYEFSVEQYKSSKENLKLAERIENKQQIKFKEGLSSSFDFTEAQRQLYSSQQSFLQTMVDVINKKASLEKILSK